MTRAQRLVAEAAEERAYQRHPDVVALRDKLTEAAVVAGTTTAVGRQPGGAARVLDSTVAKGRATSGRSPRGSRSAAAVRRRFFGDYLADARQAWRPGVVVTPAWVRDVTGCSRGLSSRLAAALTTELEAGHSAPSGGGGS